MLETRVDGIGRSPGGQTIGIAWAINPATMSMLGCHAAGARHLWARVAAKQRCGGQVSDRLASLELSCGHSSMPLAWLMSNQSGRQDNDHWKDWIHEQH